MGYGSVKFFRSVASDIKETLLSKLDLDTPGDDGVSKRAKLEKLKRDTLGQVIDPALLNELVPEPEDELLFEMFFEMYSSDTTFHIALDAYCRVWDLELGGEEITLLSVLWRETDRFNAEKIRNKQKKNNSKSKEQTPPARAGRRPSRGGIRR